jgi:hypothetical protein
MATQPEVISDTPSPGLIVNHPHDGVVQETQIIAPVGIIENPTPSAELLTGDVTPQLPQ